MYLYHVSPNKNYLCFLNDGRVRTDTFAHIIGPIHAYRVTCPSAPQANRNRWLLRDTAIRIGNGNLLAV